MSLICINKQIADKARYIAAATHTALTISTYDVRASLSSFGFFFLIYNRLFCLLVAVSLSGKSYHFWHLKIPISYPHITYYIFK